ncbi:hypothetical protein AYI69_g1369 [Smittium culicis]|uniref:Uncharacterized protein n=1 Tax=Smittium culicis TaxID=133412 RepID=A0A1R1YQH2_9FUNG|nr:hypothetical protein AYI69_g1369 [Smittium culicis]
MWSRIKGSKNFLRTNRHTYTNLSKCWSQSYSETTCQTTLEGRNHSNYTFGSALVLLRAQNRLTISTHEQTRSYSEVYRMRIQNTRGTLIWWWLGKC